MIRLPIVTSRTRAWRAMLFLSAILLVPACDDEDHVTTPVPRVSTVVGTVINFVTDGPVAGAEVSIGAVTVTTGPDGRFELQGLTAGSATLRCIAIGFEDFEVDINVPAGSIAKDIMLAPLAPLRISAGMGPQYQFVAVFRADRGVKDAVVMVNGVALPVDWEAYWDPSHDGGFYRGSLPHAVAAGMPLFLEVNAQGSTVQATGNVPESPVLSAPATGTIFTQADSVTVAWTSATDPDGFEVWGCYAWGCGTVAAAPGTAREVKIAANEIGPAEGGPVIGVVAINEGSFTGPADLDSIMSIQNNSPYIEITILP